MKHRAAAFFVSVLACTLVWGPERFPLGAGVHTEVRVQFCAHPWGHANAYLMVGMRTYERTLNANGTYTTTVLSAGEDGWAGTTIPLWVPTQEPAP